MKQIRKTINRLSISGLLLILICIGCHFQKGTGENEAIDNDDWEEYEPVDTIRIGELLSDRCKKDTDESLKKGTFTVSFDSLHEAETKLLAVLDPYVQDEVGGRYRNNNELVEVVMNHPETLGYPFARLAEKGYVDILTSQDGHLRFYCWDDGQGGTSISYKLICQYQSGRKVYGYVEQGSCPFELSSFESDDGETFYVVAYYSRASSVSTRMWLESVAIRDWRLVYQPVFPGGTHQLVLYEDAPNLHFVPYSDDCRISKYDSAQRNLYVQSAPNDYDVYHFNGKTFDYLGKETGDRTQPGKE